MKWNYIIPVIISLNISGYLSAQETPKAVSEAIAAPEILSVAASEIKQMERQSNNALEKKIIERNDLICLKAITDTSSHSLDFLYDSSEKLNVPDDELAVYSSVMNSYLLEISFNELAFRILNAIQRHMESLFIKLQSKEKLQNIPIFVTSNLETSQKKTRLFRRQLWILSASEKREERLRCWLALKRMLEEIDIQKSESGNPVVQRTSYGINITQGETINKLLVLSDNETDEAIKSYSAGLIKEIQSYRPKFKEDEIDIYLSELGDNNYNKTMVNAKAMALFDSAYSVKTGREKIALYTEAINIDPNFTAAYNNRGLCYYEDENYTAAAEDFNKVLKLDAGYTTTHKYLGNCNFKTGKLSEAIKNFTDALKYDISDTLFFVRGACYQKLQQYENAISDFSRAIKFNSKSMNAFLSRVKCYVALKMYEEAEKDYKRLIQLDQGNSTYYYNLGCIYSLEKNWNKVVDIWERGLDVNPNDKNIITNLPKAKASLTRQQEKQGKKK